MKLLASITLMSLILSCKSTGPASTKDTGTGISYLALGDSYTIGESVDVKDRYPNQLMEALKKADDSKGSTEIVAKTGWTTDELTAGIAAAGIGSKKYDLVSLLIGVNNEFRGRSLEQYKTAFKELLKQAVNFADGKKNRVFVVSIPDYGYTPYGKSNQPAISARIDQFNEAAKAITASMDIVFFDITPISRKGLSEPKLVAGDGLHPSGAMYAEWVALMKDDVAKMLMKD